MANHTDYRTAHLYTTHCDALEMSVSSSSAI